MIPRLVRSLRLSMFAGLIASAPALAAADDFRLEGASLPAPLVDAAGKVDVAIEASGVEPIGDGHRVLVAHDKHPALFVVDVATGRIVGEPITSPRFPEPSKLGGPKWEGMARDAEGTTTSSARTSARPTRSGRARACCSASASRTATSRRSTTPRSSAGTSPARSNRR